MQRLAGLPEEVKRELEDAHSRWKYDSFVQLCYLMIIFSIYQFVIVYFFFRYNFGWSHGKEKLESGKLGEPK